MFLRKLKNRSGSISVQIISKSIGKYKVLKTICFGKSEKEIENLFYLVRQEIEKLMQQPKPFVSESDSIIEQAFSMVTNLKIRTIGTELILGKIYDYIGFNQIKEELFRHLVIARLAVPLTQLVP